MKNRWHCSKKMKPKIINISIRSLWNANMPKAAIGKKVMNMIWSRLYLKCIQGSLKLDIAVTKVSHLTNIHLLWNFSLRASILNIRAKIKNTDSITIKLKSMRSGGNQLQIKCQNSTWTTMNAISKRSKMKQHTR